LLIWVKLNKEDIEVSNTKVKLFDTMF